MLKGILERFNKVTGNKYVVYSVLEVCSYIIEYSWENYDAMNNLRMQKLLYFIQLNSLAIKGRPMFREHLEAWDFGPVCPKAFKEYGWMGGMFLRPSSFTRDGEEISWEEISSIDKSIIESVVDESYKYTNTQLLDKSISQPPWKKNYHEPGTKAIPIEDMIEYINNVGDNHPPCYI